MAEFIFMLTHGDKTVANALEVYAEIRDVGLGYVGFKDVGLPLEDLDGLVAAMRAGGQEVVLEVVSEARDDELQSARAAVDLGVDYLLGGVHADEVSKMIVGTDVRYCPFPGRVQGHPSELVGSVDEIVESARCLADMDAVHGLDLLAYRYRGDAEKLIERVVEATDVPVVVAGSIDNPARIERVTALGAWAFTVGSAAFAGSFPGAGPSLREQVEAILRLSQASAPPAGTSA